MWDLVPEIIPCTVMVLRDTTIQDRSFMMLATAQTHTARASKACPVTSQRQSSARSRSKKPLNKIVQKSQFQYSLECLEAIR
mmetsp:Transcript_18914/g.44088  ORF Transcript_18914/g.44088 Transcript_18914/m.44088 type:complete len:82 (-) Transcript_18914:841-1086(-)